MRARKLKPFQQEYVKRTIRFIDENLDKRLTLDTVAKNAGVSKHHLSRLFRIATGHTVIEYVNVRRIAKAKKLLQKDKSITEVCFTVGFNDLSYFDRIFKRLTGMSPSEFQEKALKERLARE